MAPTGSKCNESSVRLPPACSSLLLSFLSALAFAFLSLFDKCPYGMNSKLKHTHYIQENILSEAVADRSF